MTMLRLFFGGFDAMLGSQEEKGWNRYFMLWIVHSVLSIWTVRVPIRDINNQFESDSMTIGANCCFPLTLSHRELHPLTPTATAGELKETAPSTLIQYLSVMLLLEIQIE